MTETDEMFSHCDSCGYVAPVVKSERHGWDERTMSPDTRYKFTCRLCNDTGVSILADAYSANHSSRDNADVKQLIAYIGNAILDAIKERR